MTQDAFQCRLKDAQDLLLGGSNWAAAEAFAKLAADTEAKEVSRAQARRGLAKAYFGVCSDLTAGANKDGRRVAFVEQLLGTSPQVCPHELHTEYLLLRMRDDAVGARNAASDFWSVIEPRLSEGCETMADVLALLLAREHIQASNAQALIKACHHRWITRLDAESLKLPYNFMFHAALHPSNQTELHAWLAEPEVRQAFASNPDLRPLLSMQWASGAPLLPAIRDWRERAIDMDDRAPHDSAVGALKLALLKIWPDLDEPFRLSLMLNPWSEAFIRLTQALLESRQQLASAPGHNDATHLKRLASPWHQRLEAGKTLAAATVGLKRKRKPKVAICVSGQLRGYQQAFRTWQRTLLSQFDADVFVHTWSKVGRANPDPVRYVLPFEGSHFNAAYRKVCGEQGYGAVKDLYPTLMRKVTDSTPLTAEALRRTYGDHAHVVIDDESSPQFAGMSNQEKMHHKIWACDQLMRRHSLGHDLVIRIRPDKAIRHTGFDANTLKNACHSGAVLFADHAPGFQFGTLMMGDQFAVGRDDVMRAYASAWSLCPLMHEAGVYNCQSAFTGHVSLAHVCWLQDIAVIKAPISFGSLLEAQAMHTLDIIECLAADAAGRTHAADQLLMQAAQADLAGQKH